MKPLVLLSFSLTFLTQGFADELSAAEPSKQMSAEEQNSNLPDEEKPQASMPSEAEDSPEWCLSSYHEMHASIRHNEAKGIGYKDGYTTLEMFGIYDGYGSGFMPFGDIRGHVFNDGKLAGNLGIGERTFLTSINHTFGSYLYYDVRRVGHGLTVNQLSPGIELVGERMEYRINGYFPLAKQKGRKYGYAFDEFKGHSILLKYKQQQAMTGGDAEVGVHIPQNTTYDVYAAAGPYYFRSSNAQSWGGRARLLGRYKEYVSLEVAYSYDKLFRSVVQGSIAFTVPFGGKLKRCGPCCGKGCPQTDNLLLSRAAFAPSRFEIPVVKKVHKQEKAIDPATGQPWVVWFVDNTSHSAGTFESPFTTIAAASAASSPNDMIYVFPGNAQYNEAVLLKDGQNFFGSGIKQQFSTTKGTKTIPAMSSNYPSITAATGGGVVTLGNGNIVSGFNITTSTSGVYGIFTPLTGIDGATVINNIVTVQVANTNGIQVYGFNNFNISNNTLTCPFGVVSTGIVVFSVGGLQNGVIRNNSISGFDNGISAGQFGSGNYTIEGNTATNFRHVGILLRMAGQSTFTAIGNTLNNNAGTRTFHITDEGTALLTSARALIADNKMVDSSATGQAGILANIHNSSLSNSNISIQNNTVQSTVGAGYVGINISADNTNRICLDLDMNTTTTVTGATGYSFTATTGTINIESITGNLGGPVSSTGNVNLVAPGTCGN